MENVPQKITLSDKLTLSSQILAQTLWKVDTNCSSNFDFFNLIAGIISVHWAEHISDFFI